MGHLHRQALVQRAKARDALIGQGMEPERAKAVAQSFGLAEIAAATASPVSDIERPAQASAKTAARKRGKKRGTKKKA